jgi:GNAT superfamily N-acetyltransferase
MDSVHNASELESEAQRIEGEAWSDLLLSAPAATRRTLGVHVEHDGDALALVCPGIHHMLVNRLFGLGHDSGLTRERVSQLISLYRERGVSKFLVHLPPAPVPSALPAWLAELGLVRYSRDWVKLARASGPVEEARHALRIAPVPPRDAEACAQIVLDAFALPAAALSLFALLPGRPRWHVFAAYDEDRPAAIAALYLRGPTGYLAFAATAPAYRGRGAQAALIERRLRVAFALGARWIVSETGVQSGDDPQHSYHDLTRAGLVPLSLRINWAPEGATW